MTTAEKAKVRKQFRYKTRHQKLIFQGNENLYKMIEKSENFVIVAPLSYAGKNKTNVNIRRMHAFALEIDDIEPKNGIKELIYTWQRPSSPLPKPTYIVCSGTGLHLYFFFKEPLPVFASIYQQLSEMKLYFLERYWNKYITLSHDKKQRAGAAQCFRAVGSACKNGRSYAMAFKVGEKIDIDYLNSFVPENMQVSKVYRSKGLSLKKAAKLYPEWYQHRIVEKQPRQCFSRHEGIYYNWIEKIKDGAAVGARYFCLENLCSLAVQCHIDPKQVEKDCHEVGKYLEGLTVSEDNHFTEHDILCALSTYHNPTEKTYTRRIEYISERTGIPLVRAKRNGQTRDEHLEECRAIRDLRCKRRGKKDWREGSGRKPKQEIVAKWQQENPGGTKAACIRDTGLDKKTVYKWWNVT
ncbi:MAG: hypothetical protein II468_04625 [Lachnospiraceae bacterium]|nr:hypothetical protein [Lachnospiraceae bacterium]